MRQHLFIALAGSTALLAGCSISPKESSPGRPSDAEIVAQIRRDVERTTVGFEVSVEGVEIHPGGAVACGVIRTPGQPRLIILSQDLDFTDDRRVTSFGVVGEAKDFALPANQELAQHYLKTCRSSGLLTNTPE